MLKVSPSFLLNLEVRPRRENKMEFNNESKSLTLSTPTDIQAGIEQEIQPTQLLPRLVKTLPQSLKGHEASHHLRNKCQLPTILLVPF